MLALNAMWQGETDDDAGSIEPSAVPTPVRFDVGKLTLARVDAFLLSQIDGRCSVDDLASLAGLPLAEACASVARLSSLGVIRIPGIASASRTNASPALRRSNPLSSRATVAPPRKTKAPPGHRSNRMTPAPLSAPAGERRRTTAPEMQKTSEPPRRRTGTPPMRRSVTPSARTTEEPAARRTDPAAAPEAIVDAIPRPRSPSGVTLDLGRKEAFVLSQIDGATRVSDLASIVGVDEAALARILYRLQDAGAIDLAPAGAPRPRRSRPEALSVEIVGPRRSSNRADAPGPASARPPPSSRARESVASPPPSSSQSRPRARGSREPPKSAEDETCDLDLGLQARIHELHACIPLATHYELLGVPRDAEKESIKRAYFALVAEMHPDRHWGKRLGPLKNKLQDVFIRLTAAHDTLVRRATRDAYDKTLPSLTPPPQAAPSAPEKSAPEASTPRERAPQASAPEEIPRETAPPRSSDGGKRARIRIASERSHPSATKVRVPSSSSLPAQVVTVPPASTPADVDDNRRHARLFVEAAERELSNGNVVAASAQFKLALNCCEMPETRKAYEAVERLASVRRLELQVIQAEVAEKESRWVDAAQAYGKAHATEPSPRVAERLANALRLSSGDLRLAAKLAEEAVQSEPQNGAFRITLGEIYADAGLGLRAQGEARRALELLPADARAQALAARVLPKPGR